jgi:hypothetical protein
MQTITTTLDRKWFSETVDRKKANRKAENQALLDYAAAGGDGMPYRRLMPSNSRGVQHSVRGSASRSNSSEQVERPLALRLQESPPDARRPH